MVSYIRNAYGSAAPLPALAFRTTAPPAASPSAPPAPSPPKCGDIRPRVASGHCTPLIICPSTNAPRTLPLGDPTCTPPPFAPHALLPLNAEAHPLSLATHITTADLRCAPARSGHRAPTGCNRPATSPQRVVRTRLLRNPTPTSPHHRPPPRRRWALAGAASASARVAASRAMGRRAVQWPSIATPPTRWATALAPWTALRRPARPPNRLH